jgi:hypothetical protein
MRLSREEAHAMGMARKEKADAEYAAKQRMKEDLELKKRKEESEQNYRKFSMVDMMKPQKCDSIPESIPVEVSYPHMDMVKYNRVIKERNALYSYRDAMSHTERDRLKATYDKIKKDNDNYFRGKDRCYYNLNIY